MIGRAAILKVAARIQAGGVDEAEALKRAEAWAAKKDAPPPARAKPLCPGPLCQCENCVAGARSYAHARRRIGQGWMG